MGRHGEGKLDTCQILCAYFFKHIGCPPTRHAFGMGQQASKYNPKFVLATFGSTPEIRFAFFQKGGNPLTKIIF